jgi:hypothetical protein
MKGQSRDKKIFKITSILVIIIIGLLAISRKDVLFSYIFTGLLISIPMLILSDKWIFKERKIDKIE